MFVGVVNFGQPQKLRFVAVKKFWSCLTMTFGHLHLVKLTSLSKLYISRSNKTVKVDERHLNLKQK